MGKSKLKHESGREKKEQGCMYFTAFVSHSVSKKDNVSVSFRVVPIEKESPTIEHIKYDTGS